MLLYISESCFTLFATSSISNLLFKTSSWFLYDDAKYDSFSFGPIDTLYVFLDPKVVISVNKYIFVISK